MSTLGNSPRLHKGALVVFYPELPVPKVIGFQYNPETMTRKLSPDMSSESGGKAEVLRIDGPPSETITLKIDFDATDGLESNEPLAARAGVYSQISALESLLYPTLSHVVTNLALTAVGFIEIVPQVAPMVLFVWGAKRVLPVRIKSLDIEETAYDERLNPIRAEVTLELTVLTYNDFSITDPGAFVFMAHQAIKEAMAHAGMINSLAGRF